MSYPQKYHRHSSSISPMTHLVWCFKISFNSQLCFKSSKSIKVNLNIIMFSHVFPCFPYEITMAFGWFWGFHPFSNGFGSTVLIRAAKEHVSQQLDVTAMQRPPEGISGAVPERGVPQPPDMAGRGRRRGRSLAMGPRGIPEGPWLWSTISNHDGWNLGSFIVGTSYFWQFQMQFQVTT